VGEAKARVIIFLTPSLVLFSVFTIFVTLPSRIGRLPTNGCANHTLH